LTSDGTSDGAIAESGFTYDGQYTTLYGGQRINTQTTNSISTLGVIVASVDVLSGSSAHFEYLIRGNSSEYRAGVVMCVWDGTNVSFTDNSTPDLNGPTTGLSFTVSISGGNTNLLANVTSGVWDVKVGTRVIF
jgi:hypothetical protein